MFLERQSAKLDDPQASISTATEECTEVPRKIKKIDAACQTRHRHFRSKAVQTSIKQENIVPSAFEISLPGCPMVTVKEQLQFSSDEVLPTVCENTYSDYQPSYSSQNNSLNDATSYKHESNRMKTTTHFFKRLAFRDLY